MTAPPYECPTTTIGPCCASSTRYVVPPARIRPCAMHEDDRRFGLRREVCRRSENGERDESIPHHESSWSWFTLSRSLPIHPFPDVAGAVPQLPHMLGVDPPADPEHDRDLESHRWERANVAPASGDGATATYDCEQC